MDPTAVKGKAMTKAEKALIISTRIRVSRNMQAFPFPTGFKNNEQRLEVEKIVKEALWRFDKTNPELAGTYSPIHGMMKAFEKFMIDEGLFFKANKFQEAVGLNNDWPKGRGIFYNESKDFLCMINQEDHLRMIT